MRGIATSLSVLLVCLTMGCRRDQAPAGKPEILVLAASSLTDVLTEASRVFERAGHGKVRLSFDATSRLARQLQQGAPGDVIVCADEAWMDELDKTGDVDPRTRVAVASNALVLIVRAGTEPPADPRALAQSEGRVVLAGESVPAGRYARDALGSLGVWQRVAPRVVTAPNVRAVLAVVARGEAVAGVVYATDAAIAKDVTVAFAFPEHSHAPVVYPAAVATHSKHAAQAEAFIAFLRSDEGRRIFASAGFRPAEKE